MPVPNGPPQLDLFQRLRQRASFTQPTLVAALVLQGQVGDTEAQRQVIATDDRRIDALRRGDGTPLRQIYADDYTLVTPSGVIRSKVEQIDDLASGRVRYGKVEVTERTVRVYGDVAIVLSREKGDILQAGRLGETFASRGHTRSSGRSGVS